MEQNNNTPSQQPENDALQENKGGENTPRSTPAETPADPPVKTPRIDARIDHDAEEKSSFGMILVILIIIAVIIIGGLYLWGQYLVEREAGENPQDILGDDEVVEDLETQDSSDDLRSIESDLNESNFEELDADMENIEGEF